MKMRIENLVEELNHLKEKHGNIEVTTKIWNEIWDEYLHESIEEVEVITDKNRKGEKVINLKW